MDVLMANGLAQGMGAASEAAAGMATGLVRSMSGTSPENGSGKLISIWVLGPLMIWAAGREQMPEWTRSALVGAGILAIFWNSFEWNRAEYEEIGYRSGLAECQQAQRQPAQVRFDEGNRSQWGA